MDEYVQLETQDTIDFLTIAGFHEHPLDSIVTHACELLDIASDVLGGDDVLSLSNAALDAHAKCAEQPGPQWKSFGSRLYSYHRRRVYIEERLAEDDFKAVDPELSWIAAERPRAGSSQNHLFDNLWSMKLLAPKQYPHRWQEGSIRLTVRCSVLELAAKMDPSLPDLNTTWEKAHAFAVKTLLGDVDLSDENLQTATCQKALQLVTSVMDWLVNRVGCFHAVVECADYRSNAGGEAVGEAGEMPPYTTWRQYLDMSRWYELDKDRINKVRGIYWGMYLAPHILDKLGGRDAFTAAHLANYPGDTQTDWRQTPYDNGGMLVKLTPYPLSFGDAPWGHGSDGTIAKWLYQTFRDADLLP